MADPVLVKETGLTNSPWLVKEYEFTAGADAAAFSHNEPTAPTFGLAVVAGENPTASEVAVYNFTSTEFTVDCEAASGTVKVYLFWVAQAEGGITA